MCTQITCDFSVTNTVATLYEHCVWSLIHVLACSSSSCLRAFVCFVCSPGYTRCSCHHRILGFLLNISVCLIQRAGSSQRAESVSLPATEIFNKYCQMSVQVISLHLHHSKGALFPSFSRDDKNEKENKTRQKLFNQPKATGFISGSICPYGYLHPTCELNFKFWPPSNCSHQLVRQLFPFNNILWKSLSIIYIWYLLYRYTIDIQ